MLTNGNIVSDWVCVVLVLGSLVQVFIRLLVRALVVAVLHFQQTEHSNVQCFEIAKTQVYYGSGLLAKDVVQSAGHFHIYVVAPLEPSHGHLTIQVVNQHGRVLQDQIAVR